MADHAITVLAEYLKTIAGGAAQGAENAARDAAAHRVYQLVGARLGADGGAHQNAWQAFTAAPTLPQRGGVVAGLAQEFERDPSFAHELAGLVAGTGPAGQTTTVSPTYTVSGGHVGSIGTAVATAPGAFAVTGSGHSVGNDQRTFIQNLVQQRGWRLYTLIGLVVAALVALIVFALHAGSPSADTSGSSATSPLASAPGAVGAEHSSAAASATAAPPSGPATPVQGAAIATVQTAAWFYTWADGSVLVDEYGHTNETPGDPAAATDFGTATVTTYSLPSGTQIASFAPADLQHSAGGCADTLVRDSAGHDILLTEYTKSVAAQGIVAGSNTDVLQALDAGTGTVLWTDALPDYTSGDAKNSADFCVRSSSNTDFLAFTTDGRYLVDTELGDAPYLIDLSTGASSHVPDATGTLGRWIVEEKGSSPVTALDLVDPATGAVAGTITNSAALSLLSKGAVENGDSTVAADGRSILLNQGSAIALPSGRTLWSAPQNPSWPGFIMVDPDTGTGFAYGQQSAGGPPSTVIAFNSSTGATMWSVPITQLCGATNGRVYVEANNQLAVLNEKTGAQITYDASITGCPTVLDGALEQATTGSAGGTVYTFTVG
ncbi:MAG TPA: PQQ-binding-like beta-propeller repeat protein [Actinocrinis sp.]|uniref:outer membrane protein assembly factor BamB family protein n=1 Tax=Actinocrinis sp. TaxID=1920516 RepID=UPI002DDD4C11|nr:PQQ-binding-like beta-propeller repeat protein [Actinocrinis sp.]HEV2347932.1 PQQ-binding-like beta-propeller repeat protein [Actinocrinis sp.]